MNRSLIVFLLGVAASVLLLAACGSDDTPPGSSDETTVTLASGGNVAGAWTGYCEPDTSDGSSSRATANFSSATAGTISFLQYPNIDCSGPSFTTFDLTLALTLGSATTTTQDGMVGASTVAPFLGQDATSATIQYTAATATPSDATAASNYNSFNAGAGAFGINTWAAGVAQSVLDLDFGGGIVFFDSSVVEQDLLYLDASSSPNRLFFGDDVDDDKSTAPSQLDDVFLVRGSSTPTDLAASVPVFDNFSAATLSTTNWPTALRDEDADCSSLTTANGVVALDVIWSAVGDCRYRMANPSQARTIATDILVSSFSQTSGGIRARIFFWAYSTGASPVDQTGDVFAFINVGLFGKVGLGANTGLITTFMGECTTSSCTSFDSLFSRTLGNIDLNTSRTILISWDGANIFTFQADGMEIFVADLATAAPYASPPGHSNPPVEFALRGSVGAVGNMSVEFDNFRCATSGGTVCVP